jgi:hypothetical protein
VRLTRSAVVAVLVLSCCAGIAGSQIGSAHAATASSGLPIKNEYQVVADTAQGHLFISQGTFAHGQGSYSDDSILVTNLSGEVVATIPGQDGVEGMALSPDGSTLYAALSTGDAVTAISTKTLKETASYPLASGDEAYSVAVQSGALWVSYRNAGDLGAIGSFNPAVTTSFTPNAVPVSWVGHAPLIAVDPSGTPGILATSSVAVFPATVATFDVSAPAAVTELASSTTIGNCAAWHGLSVLPGGKTLLCDGAAYSTASLSPLGGLEDAGITAVAADGAVAMGSATEGTNNGGPLEDLWVHSSDSATDPAAVDSLGGQDAFLTDLAWSANSQQLFAIVVTTDSGGVPNSYRLVSLSPFTDPFQFLASSFKLTSSATTVGYDGKVAVTASLGFTDTTSAAFSFYEQPAGGAKTLISSNGGNGSTITTTTKLTRTTTFTAVFTGKVWWSTKTDTETLRVTVGVGVKLSAALSGYYKKTTISGTSYLVYYHRAKLKDAVAVTPNKHGECVQLRVQDYAKGAWHPYAKTGCTALSSSSKATLVLKLAALGRFRVSPVFVHAAKDSANVNTDGPWQYYDVTK